MRRWILLVLVGCLLGSPAVHAQDGVVFYGPIQYELMEQMDAPTIEDVILEGCQRLGLEDGARIFMDDFLDEEAVGWPWLQEAVAWGRVIHVVSHGTPTGDLLVEEYDSSTVRDDRMSLYLDMNGVEREYLAMSDLPGCYRIWLTRQGIAALIGPNLAWDAIVMISACWSCQQATAWEENVTEFGYPTTVLCYQNSVSAEQAAADLSTVIRTMTCDGWAHGDTLWECQAGIAHRLCSNENLRLLGDPYNQWNPRVSCRDWSVTFERVAAWADTVAWLAEGEDPGTQYVVLGRRGDGLPADTLAVVDGAGRDGTGVVRSYAVRVPPGYAAYQVVEIDDRLVVNPGDGVRPGPRPRHWPLDPGRERAVEGRDGAVVTGPLADVPRDDPGPGERADLLVYTTKAAAELLPPVEQLLAVTTADDGGPWRYRVVKGNNDPEEARYFYSRVVAANAAYPDPDRPYRDEPVLLLVGDPDTLGVDPFLEIVDDGDRREFWRSYALITDVDGDGVPDGPVAMLPVRRPLQAARHAAAASQFLAGENVDPADGVVCFLDDDLYGTCAAGPWLAEGLFGGMADDCAASGRPFLGLYRESEADSIAAAKATGTAVLNAGVGQVWYAGLATGQEHMTWFLRDDPARWTTARHWLVFGPTCRSGAVWDSHWLFHPTIEDVMFSPVAHGVCVGGIGQINPAYTAQHMAMARILREEVRAAAPGELVCDVALRVIRRMLQEEPRFARYALGITALGTVARIRGPVSVTAVQDPATATGESALAAVPLGEGAVSLRFRLPRAAAVELSVYDLRGHRLARLLDGRTLAAGDHAVVWRDPRVASGLYLARLRAGGRTSVRRITLVR